MVSSVLLPDNSRTPLFTLIVTTVFGLPEDCFLSPLDLSPLLLPDLDGLGSGTVLEMVASLLRGGWDFDCNGLGWGGGGGGEGKEGHQGTTHEVKKISISLC